jgi:selenocysteine lyase/cysteine desulfurase
MQLDMQPACIVGFISIPPAAQGARRHRHGVPAGFTQGTALTIMPDDRAIQVRSRFPIFRHKIYLNSCSQGALSDAVEGGFRQYLESWHQYGSPWDVWVEEYERVRGVFADLIGATPDEIAIVTSASAAINAVASCLNFRQRPKIVMGEFEFPTMGHVWLAQRSRGADVQFVPARGEHMVADDYARQIDDNTALVPITHVCFKNGFRSPVPEILRIAKQHGALVMLDDYQDSGTRPVDVKALDVDFYVTGTLKYLLGPPGLAFMYVRKELIGSLTPTISGWFGQKNPFAFDAQQFDPSSSARRFESGSPAVPNVYGAAAGLELLRSIGLQRVASEVQHLTKTLLEGIAELGIQAKTPIDSVGPLVVLRCHDAEALVRKLAQRDIVVSNRMDGLRVSFHVYNTVEDVDAVLALLKENLQLLVTAPVISAGR